MAFKDYLNKHENQIYKSYFIKNTYVYKTNKTSNVNNQLNLQINVN